MAVELKFQQIVKGILQEKRPVFQRRTQESLLGGLMEGEVMLVRSRQQGFPVRLSGKNQPKMAGIDALLGTQGFRCDMPH